MELKHVAATERFEAFSQGALLADASGRVVRANAAAKAMLDEGSGIILDKGRLAAAGCRDILQKLIASCAQTTLALGGPGGEFKIPRKASPFAPRCDGNAASLQGPARGRSMDRRRGSRRDRHRQVTPISIGGCKG